MGMPSQASPSLEGLRRFLFVLVCVGLALLVWQVNHTMAVLQQGTNEKRPFGVFPSPNGGYVVQDFSYNLLYFKGIRDHLAPRPYRLEDQEKIARLLVPGSTSGLSHAYSPVTYVLAQPLLFVSGQTAYLLYTIISAVGIAFLFRFDLLPRAKCNLQLYALIGCAGSICVLSAFQVGQTTLITTSLLGVFWALLREHRTPSSLGTDTLLALLFWALCLKPSVAIVPLMLLLGACAWRALGIGVLFLLLTWTFTASHYGGWWTGLRDYQFLLNHYNNAQLTPFMQRAHEPAISAESSFPYLTSTQWFSINRMLFSVSILALLVLRWIRLITGSEHFQGMVWAFLLLSPYLLPTEDWVICLVVVEGTFFRCEPTLVACGKVLLLFAILDLRAGLTFPTQIDWYLKWLLFGWIVVEALRTRLGYSEPAERSFSR